MSAGPPPARAQILIPPAALRGWRDGKGRSGGLHAAALLDEERPACIGRPVRGPHQRQRTRDSSSVDAVLQPQTTPQPRSETGRPSAVFSNVRGQLHLSSVPPAASTDADASSTRASVPSSRRTSAAARFSSMWAGVRLPGMGTARASRASSQARASWAGRDARLLGDAAQRGEAVAIARPGSRPGTAARGGGSRPRRAPRRPPGSRCPAGPRPRARPPGGAPAAAASRSAARFHSDHSTCTAAIGCTRAARASWSAVTFERPTWPTRPSPTSSATAATVSSIGHPRVGEVRVVEVDAVRAEAPQARLQVAAHVARLRVDRQLAEAVPDRERVALHALGEVEAELGGDHDLVAAAGDRAPDQLLVVAPAVAVCGVDERRAGADRVVERRQAALLVDLAVHPRRQHHRAEPDGRHLQPVAQRPRPHPRPLCRDLRPRVAAPRRRVQDRLA